MKKIVMLMVAMCFIATSTVMGLDWNAPEYRGDPLSVHAHWSTPTGSEYYLTEFVWDSWDDLENPHYYLYDKVPMFTTEGCLETGLTYHFDIPNFVDDLPLKLLRLQLHWTGSSKSPGIHAFGEDGALGGDPFEPVPVAGEVTYASPISPFTQPDGGYQYFDLEFKPNPDWEMLVIELEPGAELVQVVVDSISIPEPATLAILGLGGLVLLRRRR